VRQVQLEDPGVVSGLVLNAGQRRQVVPAHVKGDL
jgi:hypothetical protein